MAERPDENYSQLHHLFNTHTHFNHFTSQHRNRLENRKYAYMQIRLHDFRQSKAKTNMQRRIHTSERTLPGLSDVVVQDLQTLVWFGDVGLMVRVELRAVLHSGKQTGVAIMDQPSRFSHGLQHSGLHLCKTHNHLRLHIYPYAKHLGACKAHIFIMHIVINVKMDKIRFPTMSKIQ